MIKKTLLACLITLSFLAVSFTTRSQTTLSAGDVSFISLTANVTPKRFEFVLWKTVSATTEIRFTNCGFTDETGNTIRWMEQYVIWTTNTELAAGTVVRVEGNTANYGSVSTYNCSGSGMPSGLTLGNSTGNQIFAFQGAGGASYTASASFSGTLLAGILYQSTSGTGSWLSTAGTTVNAATSYLPTSIASYSMVLTNRANEGVYAGPRTGSATVAAYRAQVLSFDNWQTQMGTTINTGMKDNTAFSFSTPPSITTQPSNATICANGNTTFSVGATNASGYQWQVNSGSGFSNITDGGVYSNATTQTLTLTGATAGMNGYTYRVVVSGSPSVTSNAVSLTVQSAPSITLSPTSSSICAGGNTSFSATVANATGYQWQVNDGAGFTNITNGGVYSGATSLTLSLTGVSALMNGYAYRLVATGTCTPSAVTSAASITVSSAPAITAHPVSTSACEGSNTSFSVTVTNATSYQWQVNSGTGYSNISNGGVYSGATTPTLSITGVSASMDGNAYRLIAAGTCTPSAVASGASLSVNTTNTWTGGVSYQWSNPANWGCGGIPTASSNVVIPSGTTFSPQIDIPDAICNDITINTGASIKFAAGSNMLEVKGTFTNNGGFLAVAGKLKLSGTAQQTIPSATYRDLELTGGDVKTAGGAINVTGELSLSNGYLELGNFNLTVGNAGSITGAFLNSASPSSFVVINGTGAFRIQNIGSGGKSGAVLFPVGTSTSSYTPVTVQNTGTIDMFSVRVINSVYDAYTADVPTGTAQTVFNVNKTWLISENTPGGSIATISFAWSAADEQPSFNRSACYVAHYTDGKWKLESPSREAASGTDPYTITVSGITSFSPFAIGSETSILPLKLISFTGSNSRTGNQLNWTTADEEQVASFQVERSADGVAFSAIGTIPAKNKPGQQNYSYSDREPVGEKTYYRLKMQDIDGAFTYSNVLVLSNQAITSNSGTYSIYPNPVVSNMLYIKSVSGRSNDVSATITDVSGKQWKSGKLTAGSLNSGQCALSVAELPAGIYVLQLRDVKSDKITVLKFQKN